MLPLLPLLPLEAQTPALNGLPAGVPVAARVVRQALLEVSEGVGREQRFGLHRTILEKEVIMLGCFHLPGD